MIVCLMKLTLLSANLWLLPPPSSTENNIRLDKFIRFAKKLDADIISLQEVWLNEYVNKLKAGLKKYHVVSPRSIIFNNSGLVTLIKQKPDSWKYYQHKMSGLRLTELLANKGYLEVNITLSGKSLTIINTHVYQSNNEDDLKVKVAQTRKLLGTSRKHNPTIISGDFNMRPEELSGLIKSMVKDSKILKTYVSENRFTFKAFNQIMNWKGIYNETPDYVFLHSRAKTAKVAIEVVTKPVVSDHYPILAKITL